MKKTIKITFLLFGLGVFWVYLTLFSSVIFPWQRDEVVETVKEWGGLANFPKNLHDLKIRKEGSLFTRTFYVDFESDEKSIENWIQNSDRLKNNLPESKSGIILYKVYPGEAEAMGGTVKIDGNKVSIKMIWS